MESINLSYNEIMEIKGFIICNKIKEINFSHNKISVVKNLSKLLNLQLLDLSSNRIESIENLNALRQNSKLKYVSLNDNHVCKQKDFFDRIFDVVPWLECSPDYSELEVFLIINLRLFMQNV